MQPIKTNVPLWWNGRHKRLKISSLYGRTGSSPVSGTKSFIN